MINILSSFKEAINLLISFDKEIYSIIGVSCRVAFFSILFSSFLGIPSGIFLGLKDTILRKPMVAIINSLMALPTVVIGLLVYMIVSRNGIFGDLGLLFTKKAIIIGQTVLAFPIITSIVYSGLSKTDNRLLETLKTLGAGRFTILKTIIYESRLIMISAILAGFGRVIGEIGVSMMLGGNIRWATRTITTTIALDSSKGDFSKALALGIVLMIISLLVNFAVHFLRINKLWQKN